MPGHDGSRAELGGDPERVPPPVPLSPAGPEANEKMLSFHMSLSEGSLVICTVSEKAIPKLG